MRIQSFSLHQYEEVINLWQRAGIQISRSDTVEGLRRKLERDAFMRDELIFMEKWIMPTQDARKGVR